MEITQEQKAILENLTCERLKAHEHNRWLLKTMRSRSLQGQSLVKQARETAMEEDLDNSVAFYVIKTKRTPKRDEEILLFFSLKCGTLFDSLHEDELMQAYRVHGQILDAIARSGTDRSELLEKFQLRSESELRGMKVRTMLDFEVEHKKLQHVKQDRAAEPNQQVLRVAATHPGVELVLFCANDAMRPQWRRWGFPRPMGEVLFWWFIAPILCGVEETVGCQYAYLFAADSSADGILLNYYNAALNFYQPEDIGTNKPWYDFLCQFMCQKTSDMKAYRDGYFRSFNPDPGEEYI